MVLCTLLGTWLLRRVSRDKLKTAVFLLLLAMGVKYLFFV